jgi:hypothetical protein
MVLSMMAEAGKCAGSACRQEQPKGDGSRSQLLQEGCERHSVAAARLHSSPLLRVLVGSIR